MSYDMNLQRATWGYLVACREREIKAAREYDAVIDADGNTDATYEAWVAAGKQAIEAEAAWKEFKEIF